MFKSLIANTVAGFLIGACLFGLVELGIWLVHLFQVWSTVSPLWLILSASIIGFFTILGMVSSLAELPDQKD